MDDIQTQMLDEQLIPLREAPRHYPGFRPHIATVHRHRMRGIRGIKLSTLAVGGKIFTSIEAIRRFVTDTNLKADDNAGSVVNRGRPMKSRNIGQADTRRADEAGRELEDLGL